MENMEFAHDVGRKAVATVYNVCRTTSAMFPFADNVWIAKGKRMIGVMLLSILVNTAPDPNISSGVGGGEATRNVNRGIVINEWEEGVRVMCLQTRIR